ncbi:YbhB/YbcL family Raf kinase inhibitor-like protein [Sphaerisporangium fuscum]|uniref:YbhB/YbcL family Raf kinase inhibitor-like protein n=1 Tax=Sphaerisporangium fuscum TaxID=2835868 RepID=UPI001BDD3CA0|nr:YbhB/YbcL family Raf kinase inhibitor-like protein [Sphaerisporangium fuscum]
MKIGKQVVTGLALVATAALAGCSTESASPASGLRIGSSSFTEGGAIPQKNACAEQGGRDVSPALAWSGVPDSARELAIVVNDSDAPGGSYIHWIVTGIPVSRNHVQEGESPGKVARGSDGRRRYAGPCPPSGTHHYHFTVYALRDRIRPKGDAKAVHQQIKDAAIASAETVGTWGH